MSSHVESLAAQFEQAARELTETVEVCTAADWRKIPAGETDALGVVAHHIAVDLDLTYQFAHALAYGTPPPAETWAQIDQANAEHSKQFAQVSKDAVLAVLQASVAPTAAALRRLSDAQLANSGIVLGKQMTVQNVVEDFVIGHFRMHLPAIRAAIAT